MLYSTIDNQKLRKPSKTKEAKYDDNIVKGAIDENLEEYIVNIGTAKFYKYFDTPFSKKNLQKLYEIKSSFFCVICKNLLHLPCQMECGCRACYACLEKYLAEGYKICPSDNCDVDNIDRLLRDKAFDREMKLEKYKCINTSCNYIASLLEFYEHRNSCRYSFENRDYSSIVHIKDKDQFNTENSLLFTDKKISLYTDSLRNEENPYTKNTFEHLEIYEDKIKKQKVQLQNLFDTLCQFNKEKKMSENKLSKMLTNIEDIKMKLEINFPSKPLTIGSFPTFIWSILDYKTEILNRSNQDNKYIYSPPFYSSDFGYKICLKAYQNVDCDGDGKNTYLSIYMIILRGKYDPLLKWPFSKKFSIELLNQKDGKNLSMMVKPDLKSKFYSRPISDSNGAIGYPKMIDSDSLKKEYLHNNSTLFIKFKIHN